MGNLHNTFRTPVAQSDSASQAMAVVGLVTREPADANDTLGVTVSDSQDHDARWTPRFSSAGDVVLPVLGDEALITFDDLHNAWVTIYWTADNEA